MGGLDGGDQDRQSDAGGDADRVAGQHLAHGLDEVRPEAPRPCQLGQRAEHRRRVAQELRSTSRPDAHPHAPRNATSSIARPTATVSRSARPRARVSAATRSSSAAWRSRRSFDELVRLRGLRDHRPPAAGPRRYRAPAAGAPPGPSRRRRCRASRRRSAGSPPGSGRRGSRCGGPRWRRRRWRRGGELLQLDRGDQLAQRLRQGRGRARPDGRRLVERLPEPLRGAHDPEPEPHRLPEGGQARLRLGRDVGAVAPHVLQAAGPGRAHVVVGAAGAPPRRREGAPRRTPPGDRTPASRAPRCC